MFEHIEVSRFEKVNLVVGKNNVGKSSLLEAVWLLHNDGNPAALEEILSIRDSFKRFGINRNDYSFIKDLFHNENTTSEGGIEITSNVSYIQLKVVSYSRQINLFDEQQESRESSLIEGRLLKIKNSISSKDYTISLNGRKGLFSNREHELTGNLVITKNIEIDKLSKLWSQIALTPLQKEVIKALQVIEPRIRDLAFIDGDTPRERKVVVVFEDSSKRISLSRMGDGINHVLAIILAMVNSKGSILLIDEFESGLHWSVQKSLWDIVFLLSKELDIQVIATTHSRDCIEAFQKSAISSNQTNTSLLIKLIEKNNKLKSKLFSLEDVQLAIEEDIEIR